MHNGKGAVVVVIVW